MDVQEMKKQEVIMKTNREENREILQLYKKFLKEFDELDFLVELMNYEYKTTLNENYRRYLTMNKREKIMMSVNNHNLHFENYLDCNYVRVTVSEDLSKKFKNHKFKVVSLGPKKISSYNMNIPVHLFSEFFTELLAKL